MTDLLIHLFKELSLAWKNGAFWVRALLIMSALSLISSGVINSFGMLAYYNRAIVEATSTIFLVIGLILALIVYIYRRSGEEVEKDKKVQQAEQRAKDNPLETQAAWDLARIKLESYLDRNLNQVRSIFWLTVVVMFFGFALIAYGVINAFENPEVIKPALLSAVSGVLINFIGATFLVLYKSTMAQAKDFVSILERINAVGMSVQILEKLDGDNKELKQTTTAELSKQLLVLYQTKEL